MCDGRLIVEDVQLREFLEFDQRDPAELLAVLTYARRTTDIENARRILRRVAGTIRADCMKGGFIDWERADISPNELLANVFLLEEKVNNLDSINEAGSVRATISSQTSFRVTDTLQELLEFAKEHADIHTYMFWVWEAVIGEVEYTCRLRERFYDVQATRVNWERDSE